MNLKKWKQTVERGAFAFSTFCATGLESNSRIPRGNDTEQPLSEKLTNQRPSREEKVQVHQPSQRDAGPRLLCWAQCSKEPLASLSSHRARMRAILSVEESDSEGTRPAGHRASSLLHCLIVPQEQEGSQGPCRKMTWVQPPWRRELGSTSSKFIVQATRNVCSMVTGLQFFSSYHRGRLRDSEKGNSSAYTQVKFAYVKQHLLWCKSKNRGATESHASILQLRKLLLPIILPQSQRMIWLNWDETNGCKVSSYATSSLCDLSWTFRLSKISYQQNVDSAFQFM